MKSRIMMSVLVIALAAALIAGATSAWFTAEADLPTAEFTAGTVIINADDGPTYAPAKEKSFENVNPGDCGRVTWKIVNEGTKKIELRVKLSELWEDELDTDNFFYAPAPNSKWVMYTDEDGEIWLYYTGGPVAGTFGSESEVGEEVDLTLVIAFDGELTDNYYQGKWFELSGLVEAVQASNGAPAAVWGDAWEDVTAEGYTPAGLAKIYLDYIKETPCYGGQEPDPDPDKYTVSAIILETGNGTVNGIGSFLPGAAVELEAIPEAGFEFTGWEGTEGLPDVSINGTVLSFIMPEGNVIVTAVFEEIPAPSEVTSIVISGKNKIEIPFIYSKTEQYTATVYDQYGAEMPGQTIVWSENKQSVEISQSGLLTVKASAFPGNVTITATVGTVSGTKTVELYCH